jgi:hypothetical protein
MADASNNTAPSFKDKPASTRMFNAGASAVLMLSCIYCGFQTISAATGGKYTGNNQLMLVASLALATVATLIMTADAYDFLMRGARKFKVDDVRKIELIVMIVLGLALAVSSLVVGFALFVTLVPAVVVYTFLVVRPTNAEAQARLKNERQETKARREDKLRKASTQSVQKRQRKGGRKH